MPPDWQEVLDRIKPCFSALAVVAGMQLDVFTPLADGARTCEELAATLGAGPERLRPLLRSLVAAELLTVEGDRFANTPVAGRFLVKGGPQYMGGAHELFFDMFSSVLPTAHSIRTGAPQAPHDWDHMADDQLRAMLRGLNPGTTAHGRMLATTQEFSRFTKLLDVGGGSGGLAVGACQTCPNLTAQVVELPRVARITEEFIATAGLASRIQAVAHDIVRAPLPDVHDAAVLRSLLQVLSAEEAGRVVANVARSLRPGGEIFIIGAVLDDDGMGPAGALALDLFFLNAFENGQAYTESQYRTWLEAAGFVDVKRSALPLSLDLSLVTARKRG
jgi:SAM-dependent methyltransferase